MRGGKLCVSQLSYILWNLVIFTARNAEGLQVEMKNMEPVFNSYFYVECEIHMSASGLDDIHYSKPVEIFGPDDKKCAIKNWRFCDQPLPPRIDGSCGCASKKIGEHNQYIFHFYMFLNPVTMVYDGQDFICKLGPKPRTRTMDVVTFTQQPDPILYVCSNKSWTFKWEFSPASDIKKKYRVDKIHWRSIGKSQNDFIPLGTYSKKSGQFSNDRYDGSSYVIEGDSELPKLNLKSVPLRLDGREVWINVTFDVHESGDSDDENVKRKRKANTTETKLGGGSAIVNSTSVRTTATTTTTTTPTTTTTTVTTTTTPPPVDLELRRQKINLIDKTKLVVVDPPSQESVISISAVQTEISRTFIITCEVNSMKSGGKPAIEIAIWQDNKLLTSKSGTKTISYSTVSDSDVICGLRGQALDCLETAIRNKNKTYSLKEAHKNSLQSEASGGDLKLALYVWESAVCIILMCWAVSLFLDHVSFLLRQKKRKLLEESAGLFEVREIVQVIDED